MNRLFAAIALLCPFATVASEPIGFQAFNWSFDKITRELPALASQGFTHVQVSPVQKSLPRPEWWAAYQPVDYRSIEGPLGDEAAFRRMTDEARKQGIEILVDVVLNHMAAASAYPTLQFPQFGPQDFHYPDTRPCIRDWSNRYEVTRYWLCFDRSGRRIGGGLADLDTSSQKVRSIHRAFLEKLLNLGARGFRFDAAKHVEPEYFAAVLAGLSLSDATYGEVIPSSPSESLEYTPYMRVTDYGFLGQMLAVFNDPNGELRALAARETLPSARSLAFVRNHDTAMGDHFFAFDSAADIPLAYALIFARGKGIPFVFSDDANLPAVRAGIEFYRRLSGEPMSLPDPGRICPGCDRPQLAFIARGSRAWAWINHSDQWFSAGALALPSLEDGCYTELTYGFPVRIQSHKVALWSKPGDVPSIGPKTALFLVREPACGGVRERTVVLTAPRSS